MLVRANTTSLLIVCVVDQVWSQLRVKVDSAAALVVPASDAIRVPNVQAPWVAGGSGGEPRQGPQVVRVQSSTTETSVTNSSFSGITEQTDCTGRPLTSRLDRTGACCWGVPVSVRVILPAGVEAREISEALKTSMNRARTILGLIFERRRLMVPSPSGRLFPW